MKFFQNTIFIFLINKKNKQDYITKNKQDYITTIGLYRIMAESVVQEIDREIMNEILLGHNSQL